MAKIKAKSKRNAIAPVYTPELPQEVWTLIGDVIHSRETLRALVSTSRHFRDTFTPILHARRSVILSQCKPWKLGTRQKPLPTVLEHTRHFEVVFHEFVEAGLKYELKNNKVFAAFLTRMLEAMPNLRSFCWTDRAMEDKCSLSLILRNPQVIKALEHCKQLAHVTINFSYSSLDDPMDSSNCWMSLNCFQNLTSLELMEFYSWRQKPQLLHDLTELLARSPRLKYLGLGMAVEHDLESPDPVIIEDDVPFLQALCIIYYSKGYEPLSLETLRLGQGMYLCPSENLGESDAFLSKLVKLSGLRILHLFNGFVKWDAEEEDFEPLEIDWDLLDGCDSLHHLAISRLEPEVRGWLNDKGKSVQELVVTEQYLQYDDGLDEFDRLELPHLTMISTVSDWDRKRSVDDVWMDLSEDPAVSVPGLWREFKPRSEPRKYDRWVITVLDRLHDGGAQLTHLRLCFSFDYQWELFYENLWKLTNLTQLCLRRMWTPGQYPPKRTSLWPNVTKAKDIAWRYAQLIRLRCRKLQYIRIHRWAWRVSRIHDTGTRADEKRGLVELDKDEILSIELFSRGSDINLQCGLPGLEEPYDLEEYSDIPTDTEFEGVLTDTE